MEVWFILEEVGEYRWGKEGYLWVGTDAVGTWDVTSQ